MKASIRYLFSYGLLLFASMYVVAQDDITRTPSGRPDFNGNYDISSLTPFQRPAEYGARLFLDRRNTVVSCGKLSKATR